MVKTTFIGAASAAVTFGIGEAAGSLFANFYSKAAFQAVAHGTFQGGMTAVSGGKFWSGFAAGALSSIASSAWSGGTTETTGFSPENNWAYGAKTITHAGLGNGTGSLGMIAFGTVTGGAGAVLTGGNFWQGAVTGLVVSGLNHFAHMNKDGEEEGKISTKAKPIPKELAAKINQLRKAFDFMEDYGGYVEIAGLVLAPFTEGASLGATGVGVAFTAVGTTGNVILDVVEYKYTNDPIKLINARNRVIKYGLTLGTGKALDKLTLNFADKLITKFLDVVIDKGIYSTIVVPIKK